MNIRFATVFVLLALLASACATTTGSRRAGTGRFVSREVAVDGMAHRYQVFVPAKSTDAAHPPVILFLHGAGERGSDNRTQLRAGLGPYLQAHAADFPAIVVLPQVPPGEAWLGDNVRVALAALDAATREFGGDASRTYLTGMSMGGYGTWETALRQPQRFAALVPICGALKPPPSSQFANLRVTEVADLPDRHAALAARLANKPIWIFHGALDDVVPPDDDRKTFAALKAVAGNVRYTEFPDANHNAWDPAYNTPELWTWLFAQKLP